MSRPVFLKATRAAAALFLLVLASVLVVPADAAELKPKTLEAFERYVRLTEARMEKELRSGEPYLWFDALPESRRRKFYEELREGRIVIERQETREDGKSIAVPDGLIHHWLGVVFLPGTTLQRVLAVVQDYDNHWKIYKPDVRRSKLLHREGNDFKIYLQFYKKTIRTVVLNAEFDVRYVPLDATRVYSRSYSTRIAEIENPDQPDEHENPVDRGHGYVWRLYTYWRYLEKDGGVYIQLEYIALSRGVPVGLGWLINPLIRRVSRGSLFDLLNATRAAISGTPASGMVSAAPAIGVDATRFAAGLSLRQHGEYPPANLHQVAKQQGRPSAPDQPNPQRQPADQSDFFDPAQGRKPPRATMLACAWA